MDWALARVGGATAEAILDAIRDHPEWTTIERERAFDALIGGFPLERLGAVVRGRLGSLSGEDAEPMLRIVEAIGSPELLATLAEAVRAQPDLPAEVAWGALAVLGDFGLVDADPALLERWDDVNEQLGESSDGSIAELVAQLEDDPGEVWVALHGLGQIEPEIRGSIVSGLDQAPAGPGLIEFLRLLAYSQDPSIRACAFGVLAHHDVDDDRIAAAWASIAADHPEPPLVSLAQQRLLRRTRPFDVNAAAPSSPILESCLVTPVDGRGRGRIALTSRVGTRRTTAAYLCDVELGIVGVVGEPDPAPGGGLAAEIAEAAGPAAVIDIPELALGLLAGSLGLCGPSTDPSLRHWLERTVPRPIRAQPFAAGFADFDPASTPHGELADRAALVLAACPDWADDSKLTFDLAEELADRNGPGRPDPRRDAGAYRYLFEHRLRDRLESYRRMLCWMAALWNLSGDLDRGRSALSLAWQLSDPQHAVPGHPFIAALATLSLVTAQARLARGDDPR